MNVGELRAALAEYDDDREVFFNYTGVLKPVDVVEETPHDEPVLCLDYE